MKNNESSMVKPISEVIRSKYIVPLYQRNFAWGELEVKQLVSDLYRSYKNGISAYFIGSLVYIKRDENTYEVIDGQQRLTAISLLLKYLSPKKKELLSPFLSYDSRPEVCDFLGILHSCKELYQSHDSFLESLFPDKTDERRKRVSNDFTIDFIRALDFIDSTPLDISGKCTLGGTLTTNPDRGLFADYILEHTMLVMVEMPKNTDVASYFEIMNNRGVQLQSHEILKSKLMEKIASEASDEAEAKHKRSIFSIIWDACSEMDHCVQWNIKGTERRKHLFGVDYCELKLDNVDTLPTSASDLREGKDINAIFNSNDTVEVSDNEEDYLDSDDSDNSVNKELSIIDFQNFLLQVFKVLYNSEFISSAPSSEDGDNGIPLHEKYLLEVFNKLYGSIKPMEFIKELLKFRVIFDRYVVKVNETTSQDGKTDDDPKWVLHVANRKESKKVGKNGKVYLSYTVGHEDTFSRKKEQEYIIKALSMLQVTYRQRRYKNYLTYILNLFKDRELTCDPKWYLDKLNRYILNEFEKSEDYQVLRDGIDFDDRDSLSLGTRTPHPLFNFIDYLYWLAWKKGFKKQHPELAYLDDYKSSDFVFKYTNSVEHHFAQSFIIKEGNYTKYIDSLGNLCLVSKSANSSLGNQSPIGKSDANGWFYHKDLPPMRKIMYDITNDKGWDNNSISQRYNDIVKLIQNRAAIFGIGIVDPESNEAIRSILCSCDLRTYCFELDYGYRYTIHANYNDEDVIASLGDLKKYLLDNPQKDVEDYIERHLSDNEMLKDSPWQYVIAKYPSVLEYCQEKRIIFEDSCPKLITVLKSCKKCEYNFRDLGTIAVLEELVGKGYSVKQETSGGIHWAGVHIGDTVLWFYHESNGNWKYYLEANRDYQSSFIKKLNENGWGRIATGQYAKDMNPFILQNSSMDLLAEIDFVTNAVDELCRNATSIFNLK